MLIVHHLNNSRSQRILWMLEELGVDYQIKHYQRDAQTMLAPKELFDIHPLGKSPVLQDGDKVIAETGAIIDYLAFNYSINSGDKNLAVERDNPAYQDYNYWLHYGEGSLMTPLILNLVFDRLKNAPMPFFIKPIARKIADKAMQNFVNPNIKRHFAFINDYLTDRQWFAGDSLSGADVQMIFPLESAVKRDIIDVAKHPAIVEYVKRVHQRPEYQTALEKGGQYDFA